MDYCEKWGKSVDEAVRLALADMKLTEAEVDVEVLEEPTKGFLGLGAKLAKVRVTRKGAPAKEEAPAVPEKKTPDYGTLDLRSAAGKGEAPKPEAAPRREKRDNRRKGNRDRKKSGGKTLTLPEGSISVIANKPDDLVPVTEHEALDFLKETTEKMGLSLEFKAEGNEENLYIEIIGADAGAVIGKRGQTLDAIQYLTSLVVNKNHGKYVRVILDAENYRAKREKTLQQLAIRLGNKVIRTGRPVKLEPMNPYERMVIHATLHGFDEITTRSEGEEPYRKVVIEKA